MTNKITLSTADLSEADIQAALDTLEWGALNASSHSVIYLAAALRLIREERADYNALMAAYEELQDTNASILSETMEFKRKVSDAMKAVQAFARHRCEALEEAAGKVDVQIEKARYANFAMRPMLLSIFEPLAAALSKGENRHATPTEHSKGN